MRRAIGFFSVKAALSMFVLGTGCSSGVTSPPEPSSPLLAVWLADAWLITDLSDPDRVATIWNYRCRPPANPPVICWTFWLSATQDSFEIGTIVPPIVPPPGVSSEPGTPLSLSRGSLALHGIRATLTGAFPSGPDDRLPSAWEAMLEGDVLTIEGTGTLFPGEDQLRPARWVVRLRRCHSANLVGQHGVGGWCDPYSER